MARSFFTTRVFFAFLLVVFLVPANGYSTPDPDEEIPQDAVVLARYDVRVCTIPPGENGGTTYTRPTYDEWPLLGRIVQVAKVSYYGGSYIEFINVHAKRDQNLRDRERSLMTPSQRRLWDNTKDEEEEMVRDFRSTLEDLFEASLNNALKQCMDPGASYPTDSDYDCVYHRPSYIREQRLMKEMLQECQLGEAKDECWWNGLSYDLADMGRAYSCLSQSELLRDWSSKDGYMKDASAMVKEMANDSQISNDVHLQNLEKHGITSDGKKRPTL